MNLNIKSLFNFNKKTILITGSSGQIGSSIVKLFLDIVSKVYGFDKTKNTIILWALADVNAEGEYAFGDD